jgi:hypothetical protein
LVIALTSNVTNLSFDDVVSSLFSKEMRLKNMEWESTKALFARGHSQERNRSNSSSGRSKYKGISKSLGKFVNAYWRCGKQEQYKN